MVQTSSSTIIPQVLTLSNDAAIESILSDIPFFSVGLLGFGVFTFFFVMRRVSMLSMYLYGSVLVAFVAAILDLSQLLASSNQNSQATATSKTSTDSLNDVTAPLVIAREIAFSISIGMRFLFFWLFVAKCPWGEKPLKVPKPSFLGYDPGNVQHSGSWASWGMFGIILKVLLLKIAVAIAVLQLIWRLVADLRTNSAVYQADATLEIVASAMFILKMILNTLITPVRPTLKVLRFYLVPIAALCISIGVPIGNLISFAFSETTLGRFLQAVELYALILFVLITAFYGMREDDAMSINDERGISSESFRGLPQPRYSTFRVGTPPVPVAPATGAGRGPSPDNSSAQGQGQLRVDPRPSAPSRESTASRISTWIDRRISRRRSVEGDKDRLWSRDQAERGQSPVEKSGNGRFSMYSPTTDEPRQQSTWNDPMFSSVTGNRSGPPSTLPHPYAPYAQPLASAFSVDSADDTPPPPLPQQPTIRAPRKSLVQIRQPSSRFSLSSYYSDKRSAPEMPELAMPPVTPSRGADSPIYGLNGIMPNRRQPSPQPTPLRNSASSIDELLRQQRELDKSIAALHLFSPRDSATGFAAVQNRANEQAKEQASEQTQASSSLGEKDMRSSASSVGHRMESGSVRSDFSLSNFPTPPLPNTELPGLPANPAQIRPKIAAGNPAERVSAADVLSPPRMPAAAAEPQSLPGTMKSEDLSRATRLDSSGTQYDVTSFIGGLTGPRSMYAKGGSIERLADIASDDGSMHSENSATIVTAQPGSTSAARPLVLGTGMAFTPAGREASNSVVLPPATASSGVVTAATPQDEGVMARSQASAASRLAAAGAQEPMPTPTPDASRLITQNVLPPPAPPTYTTSTGLRTAPRPSRFGPKQQGLPSRPRLTISGPRPLAPLQNGKDEPSPTAFERPRPPPLILNPAKNTPASPTGRNQGRAF